MKQSTIFSGIIGYTLAKIGIHNLSKFAIDGMMYMHNKRKIERCRVVDVMGDTLYYDFRMW